VTAHLTDVRAQQGAELAAGGVIGRVGRDPFRDAPGIYFEIRRGSVPLDPARWLSR
jgi:septal ring factor EnvC (AmiA/AmiB activator)